MAIIKCKMCGGDLNVAGDSQIAVCEYCGTQQTVPKQDNEKKLTLFARANRLRFSCEFDKAAGVYESIVAEFPEEPEAYWGLVLCKYGIEYVDDPATGKKVPTCHRSSFDSVLEDANFELVMEYSDVVTRKIYREEAKAIEELRRGIIEVSSREEPYDIFICYKETDENGQRTLDSVLAQDLYDALTEKGYRVFFSRITLEDKLGQEYEPYIFAALNSARVMLAVGTDYEYYNAPWVKNEWSRYLQLIAAGQKKSLIPCYKNIDAHDMPKEFAKLQADRCDTGSAARDRQTAGQNRCARTRAAAADSRSEGTAFKARGYVSGGRRFCQRKAVCQPCARSRPGRAARVYVSAAGRAEDQNGQRRGAGQRTKATRNISRLLQGMPLCGRQLQTDARRAADEAEKAAVHTRSLRSADGRVGERYDRTRGAVRRAG